MFKIAIISPSTEREDDIVRIIQTNDPTRHVEKFGNGVEKLAWVAENIQPDLVIIDRVYQGSKGLEELAPYNVKYPDMRIIIISENTLSDFLVAAIRSGVEDVVTLPLDHGELETAIKRVESKAVITIEPKKNGKVLTFIAGKGGGGATFLTCNLAYIISELYEFNVAILDLKLQFGDASLFMTDQSPSSTLSDIAKNITRLDASFLASSMMKITPKLSLLAAPENEENLTDIKSECIESLIKIARSQYDYVLLDIGKSLNTINLKALDFSDQIFVVAQQTIPFIRATKHLIHTLESLGYDQSKVKLVINRFNANSDIQLNDIEATLGMEAFATIPNNYHSVCASINQGVPIIKLDPNDSVSKYLKKMAQKITNKPEIKSVGFFENIFKNSSKVA
ncbi:MAG: AAA family ATPase [Methylophilales bacterium]|nr:AAA family ATPase [Methylophilales bacterium]